MTDRVRITDVSPRDGLQNEAGAIPWQGKVQLIRLLAATGVDEIEATSFVSPKWVPQLGDAAEVLRDLIQSPLPASIVLSALVPNEQGLARALAINDDARRDMGRPVLTKFSVFTAASETFAKRNTNATIAETIERFKPVIAQAHATKVRVRGYVSCAIACPFEGPIEPARVVDVVQRLVGIGCDEIDVADTIGVATPETMRAMLTPVLHSLADFLVREGDPPNIVADRFTLHLHDTFGNAGACVREALFMGVRSFDGSVAGLGGCPYASTPERRAPGNIATETLVRVCDDSGFRTSTNNIALNAAAGFARSLIR